MYMKILCSFFPLFVAFKIKSKPTAKGQLNSESIHEVIISPKMPTQNLKDFCPGSLLLKEGFCI